MQVPIRKPGRFTHQKKDPNITQEKFSELAKKLEKIKKRQPELIKEVQRASQFGDFSENAEYQIAKGKLRSINQKILEIQDQLKKAVIIQTSGNKGQIQLGSKVTIKIDGTIKCFMILGSAEANPAIGIISHNSPIGSSLIGYKKGDTLKIKLAEKFIICKIIKVE